MTTSNEARPAAGYWAYFRAGLVVGALLGLAVAAAVPVIFPGEGDTHGLAVFFAATLMPIFAAAAGLLAFLFRWAAGKSERARDRVRLVVAVLWVSVLAYAVLGGSPVILRKAQPPVWSYLAVVMGAGALTLLVCWLAGRLLLKPGARGRGWVSLAVVTAFWAAATGWSVFSETRSDFPRSVPLSTDARPNVILIVLDTTRADHLSCYGYRRKTTPNIDAAAAQGRIYTNAMSPSTWTGDSHASLFTGLPVTAHGTTWLHLGIDKRFPTLAEHLRSAGYQTVGLSSNPNLTAARAFNRGFDVWEMIGARKARALPMTPAQRLGLEDLKPEEWYAVSPSVNRRLGEWFKTGYRPDKPFFVFLNYMDTHLPYLPPRGHLQWCTPEMFAKWEKHDFYWDTFNYMLSHEDTLSSMDIAEMETLYDEELAYLDVRIGEVLSFLRRTGLDRTTLVCITADHGETFGEHHMMEHQYSVYEPLAHVPLIVRWPGHIAPSVDNTLVQSHDLFPTILEAAQVPWTRTPAHNALSLLHPQAGGRVAVSEYLVPYLGALLSWSFDTSTLDLTHFLRPLRAVRVGSMKLIQPVGGPAELYDLAKDPFETRDLAAEQPETVQRLRGVLLTWLRSFEPYQPSGAPAQTPGKITQEELERLRGLGYIR